MKLITKNAMFLQSKRALAEARKVTKKNNIKLRLINKARKKRKSIKITNLSMRKKRIANFKLISSSVKEIRKRGSHLVHEIEIPKDFSLISNPEKVLNIISEIAHLKDSKRHAALHLDHRKSKRHDLGAEVLLGAVAKDLEMVKDKPHKPFIILGRLPENEKMSRLISSIGIAKEVGTNFLSHDESQVTLFKGFSDPNESLSVQSSSQKQKVISALINHMNKCLNKISKKLSENGDGQFRINIGEIIDNAEGHSGGNGSYWYAYGYLDETDPKKLYTEIVIYNLGVSIPETFIRKRDEPSVYTPKIKEYVNKHSKNKYTENELLMVMSLQQFVSSKRDKDTSRGNGLTDLLMLFDSMAKECFSVEKHSIATVASEMCILSGNTHIKLDGTYTPQEGSDGATNLYLNPDNTAAVGPDRKYVNTLRNLSFPGTIIAMRVPLKDDSFVEEIHEQAEQSND